jgi:hypothetical protein
MISMHDVNVDVRARSRPTAMIWTCCPQLLVADLAAEPLAAPTMRTPSAGSVKRYCSSRRRSSTTTVCSVVSLVPASA